MNITIKSLKINKAMSEETQCFSATIYLDGKHVGDVCNRGCGGSHEYHWLDREVGQRLHAWAKTQKLKFDFEHLDQVLDALMDRIEDMRWLQARVKKKTLFRLKGDKKGGWSTIARAYSPEVKTHLLKKYGGRLECIANEDLEKAMEYQR